MTYFWVDSVIKPITQENCRVYTPIPLAESMVRIVGDSPNAHWLEPSFGTGNFLNAISKLSVPPSRVTAIDLDECPSPTDHLADSSRGVDFLAWSTSTDRRFDKIVGNPPYVSMHRLCEVQRASARATPSPDPRLKVAQSSNLWLAFLHACLFLLKRDGDIALVLPAAWQYADYAKQTRLFVDSNFADVTMVRPKNRIFSGVKDGSVILIAKGYKNERRQVSKQLTCDIENIESEVKTESKRRFTRKAKRYTGPAIPLREIVRIGIGGVTGHTSYFLMNEQKRKELKLPARALLPVVSRKTHLREAILEKSDWQILKEMGERVWLFSPTDSVIDHPAVSSYLSTAVKNGGCDRTRTKIISRTPWYRTSMPMDVDAFLSGMSSEGPWLCINEWPQLSCTNTLYTLRFKHRPTLEEKCALGLSFLSPYVRNQFDESCRIYPDGLRKHEPRDISSIRIPLFKPLRRHISLYRKAIELHNQGRHNDMAELLSSEKWFA